MRDEMETSPQDVAARKEAVKRELRRRGGLASLVFFLEQVLQYPKFDEVHEEIGTFLKRVRAGLRRGLLLIPRGHLKSTTVTVGYVTQRIVENPNIRVLITNAILENSKGFLREIKMHFEKGEKLRDTYGDFVNSDEKWSEMQIVVSRRTKVQKEPTVQATSIDKSVVSQHYDLIVADDLVNRETISTKEQRAKLALYLKDLIDLLEPDGELILIGTRWHHDDLYGRLLREHPELWMLFHRTCWKDDDESKRVPLFRKFTPEYLDQLRVEKGPYEFSCQYLNSPTDDQTAEFKREWVLPFELSEIDGKPFNLFVAIDPAFTMDDRNDATGLAVVAVDADDVWWVLKAVRLRVNPTALVEELFSLKRMYGTRLKGFAMERTAHTLALQPAIEMKQKEYGVRLDITDVSPYARNKKDRIRSLIPRMEQGKIRFSPYSGDAVEELLAFPRAESDDVADALAYMTDIAHGRGVAGGAAKTGKIIRPKMASRR